jgi:undecaprenyl pyrophosphate phosphatase UppP
MPDAKLPTSFKGWIVALGGAYVGFISGFITIRWLNKVMK